MKKGLFGGEKEVKRTEMQWVQTGWSDKEIDGKRLAKDIASAVSQLNIQGYDIVSITEVTSGKYSYEYKCTLVNAFEISRTGGWGYGYGYSYTEGVIIIAKKI